jgi:tetratricopeptide (TPR) repeat protein
VGLRAAFKLRLLLCLACSAALPVRCLPAAESAAPAEPPRTETLAEQTLRDIAARQRELFAKADKEGDQFDEPLFHGEAQSIASSYDVLVQKNPNFAAAYAAYGVFLGKVGMTRQAVAILLKANQLDPNIAIVKNQIAKHLAEDGKPVDALPWLMSAIDLEPKEPLYHYNLGQLLLTGRDSFLASGDFTRAGLDKATLDAFQRAADLSPLDLSLAYQHAKAYYDVDPPRWEEALAAWKELETRPIITTTMRQLVRLQKANVLLKLNRRDEARDVLDGITDPKLADEKKTLLDQLAPKVEK